MRSIHLHSDLAEEPEPNGDARVVRFLLLIGVLVLVIAWINYVNLSTARAMERAREVGVRKVVGAEKSQLMRQFLVESALMNLFAALLAVVLAALALPGFNQLAGLSMGYANLWAPWALGLLAMVWLTGTFLSGLYPAWVLSGFRPITVLKGQYKNTGTGMLLRKGLVLVQFTASVALIAGTVIIYRQLDFMLHRDIGMKIDQVLVVERPGIAPRDREARNAAIDVFRAELAKNPDIRGMAAALTVPGKQREYKAVVSKFGEAEKQGATLRINSMDFNFKDIFEMKLLAGRNFSPDFPADPDTSCILTESAVRMLGFDNPEAAIGKTLTIPNFRWNPIVAGVVNDYHQVSLKKAVDPTLFFCTPYSGEFLRYACAND
ncbi:MAG: FtsX-like permease family protein [Lewinellaceae bacterium]|nr:FtsX-like permease family protein [Lewinellaceae bacterium]